MYSYIKTFLALIILLSAGYAQKNITIDFNNEIGPVKDLMGMCDDFNVEKFQDYYKEIGLNIVRAHTSCDIFDYYTYTDFFIYDSTEQKYTQRNEDFDPTNTNNYHWRRVDSLLTIIFNTGLEVLFRFGPAWTPNPDEIEILLKAPLDPDGKNFTKFASLCKHTVMHINSDWDNGMNKRITYWEVWNEPGNKTFWRDTPVNYYNMYKAVYDSIKKFDPTLKVGAPGAYPVTTLGMQPSYREEFIKFLRKNNIGLDFYSWHIYGLKNPYNIKQLAKKIRTILDTNGFVNTENIVDEINNNLDNGLEDFINSAKGAAYYASILTTAQESDLDKLFWFAGYTFFLTADMKNPKKIFKWGALALKCFGLITQNTQIRLKTTGNEVVETELLSIDTTNFVSFASKSQKADKLYILISNYNSINKDYNIQITNLPWEKTDSIKIIQNIIKAPKDSFTQKITYIKGNKDINLSIKNMPAPSVLFLRLEKMAKTSVDENNIINDNTVSIFPNPVIKNSSFNIKSNMSIIKLEIFNITGQKIKNYKLIHNGKNSYTIKSTNIKSGIYFIKIYFKNKTITKKFTIIK